MWSTEDFRPPRRPAKKIVNATEVKPEDWEEEKLVPDLEAPKPEDWDESVKGVWKPKLVKNPNYRGERWEQKGNVFSSWWCNRSRKRFHPFSS